MKLQGLATQFPSKHVSNQQLLALIEENSREISKPELHKALQMTEAYLEATASRGRYWTPDSESLRANILSCVDAALTDAQCDPMDIELVIHASVTKAFTEPGDAYFCAEATGLHRARCFDVRDACNGWSTAALLAQDLIKAGRYKNALVINTEFPTMVEAVFPRVFNVKSLSEVAWKFPGQTLGDAVSVTVFTEGGDDWVVEEHSEPRYAGLCFAPTDASSAFLSKCGSLPAGEYETDSFVSFGRKLQEGGTAFTLDTFQRLELRAPSLDIVIPHTSGERTWRQFTDTVGVLDKTHFVYQKYGNVVSCSFPVGLQDAREQGKLKSGDQVAGWISAAGMSCYAFAFSSSLN